MGSACTKSTTVPETFEEVPKEVEQPEVVDWKSLVEKCTLWNAPDRVKTPKGESLWKKEVFIRAINDDPTYALAYFGLGRELWDGSKVTFDDKREMNEIQCFEEALKLDPMYEKNYWYASIALREEGATCTLPDGRKVDRRGLFMAGIATKPNGSLCYEGLAGQLSQDESVTLDDGRTMTKKDLLVEALKNDWSDFDAYKELVETFGVAEPIDIGDGKHVSRKDVWAATVSRLPQDYESWIKLARCMTKGETMTLKDGTQVTKRDCYLRVLAECRESEPLGNAWVGLGLTLDKDEKLEVLSKGALTRKDIFKEACCACGANPFAYENLAYELADGEEVDLYGIGNMFGKIKLLQQTCFLEPSYDKAFYEIGLLLKDGETCDIKTIQDITADPKIWTKEEFLARKPQ